MGIKLYIYCVFFLSYFLVSQSVSDIDLHNQFMNTETSVSQKEYNIAFLLPFCTENNSFLYSEDLDSLMLDPALLQNYDFYKKTQISLDFFLGFLLSLNVFQDFTINVSVFDIKEGDLSKNVLKNILYEGYLDDVDLVFGPLFTDNVVFFTNRFNQNIPVVSPFSKKSHVSDSHDNIFQAPVDIMDQLSIFAKQIFNKHRGDNILLIKRDTIFESHSKKILETEEYEVQIDTLIPKDINYGEIFLNSFDNVLLNTTDSISFKEINVPANVIDSVHHELDTLGMANIVIVASEDDVFVTDLLSKLHACRDTGMIVYCLPVLADFNHISIYDLMDMNVTFPHNKVFNYEELEDFIIQFYDMNNYLPNLKYASVGYELGIYFLQLLLNYGDILPYVDYYQPQTILGAVYDFKKTTNGGYRNNAISILRYDDFGYKRLSFDLE